MTKSAIGKLFLSFLLVISAVLPYAATQAEAADTITVGDAIANNAGAATVKGFIVGTATSGTNYVQEAPFTSATNIGLADSVDETDPAKILPVQLPSGAIRTALNLKDNPHLFKGEVTVTGIRELYFQVPGLKSPTAYTILSEGAAPPEATVVGSLAEARTSTGDLIQVEGIVTTGTGFWGGKAFYIQDETAGFYVYTTNANVAPGDLVRLTGKVSAFGGELQLQPNSVETISTGNELPALLSINPTGVNEDTQGELIELKNVTITNLKSVNNFGTFEFTAADADGNTVVIRNDNRNGLAFDRFTQQYKEGDLVNVTGIASKFNDAYQVKTLGLESFDLVNKPAVYVNIFPGIVSQGTEIVLESGWESAAIHYTIDGSTPTAASTKYTSPLVLAKDTTIKAIAVGSETSQVFIFDYTVLKTADLRIRDIQGDDHYSDYTGVVVNEIQGVVTHIYNSANFVIQDINPDNDLTTSEALMVNLSSNGLKVGDLVTVAGTVEEHFQEGYSDMRTNDLPITRIRATAALKEGTAQLPEPIVIGVDVFPPSEIIDNDGLTSFDPEEDGIDFWESLELMRIAVPNAQIVGPQKYGEVIVVAENSPNTEFHNQGGILLSENDFNPERIIVDFDNESFVAKAGDSFNGTITGVMGYGFGNYKLWAVESDIPELVVGDTTPETTWITADEEKLTVATYNVENFSADPAHTSNEKAARIGASFVENLKSPDVVALVEVQDNDGPIQSNNSDATQSYERLIAEIKAAGGPAYEWTDIAPEYNKDGGQPGGNIRVGFLYNPERVTLSEGTKGTATQDTAWVDGELSLNPGRVQPIEMPSTRKPLAAQFDFQGEKFIVIAAHLNSKGGDQPLFGKNQPPVLSSETQRIELAKAINNFIVEGQKQDPDLNVIVAGDMNDFEFTPSMQALKGDILTNKVEDVPLDDRYSYYYQGNSQVLDHILVTNNIAAQTEIDMVHINSMFMEQHGRASDHDPVLVQIDFAEPAATPEDPEVPVIEMPFTDVKESDWSYEFIKDLFDRGIVNGTTETTFSPKNSLTRFQAVTILTRMLEMDTANAPKSPFKDISRLHQDRQDEINAAYAAGIITGKTTTEFKPNEFISRAHFALLLDRVYTMKNGDYKIGKMAPYSDLSKQTTEEKEAITLLHDLKIVQGYNGKFNPFRSTTREEAAKMFSLFLPYSAE
ncbi:MAG TPA: S-layer homology domain-containing protein [Planococcus sp. (in: firmicutes)]|nr:S-layer homology domain-containing protein [Planococcus sp. (in: firmicutes)]